MCHSTSNYWWSHHLINLQPQGHPEKSLSTKFQLWCIKTKPDTDVLLQKETACTLLGQQPQRFTLLSDSTKWGTKACLTRQDRHSDVHRCILRFQLLLNQQTRWPRHYSDHTPETTFHPGLQALGSSVTCLQAVYRWQFRSLSALLNSNLALIGIPKLHTDSK